MKRREWTREMYMQIDELLSKGITNIKPKDREKLRKSLDISSTDLIYRIKVVKERRNILTWRIEEFQALKNAVSFDDFLRAFRAIYSNNFDAEVATNHWRYRDEYLGEWKEKRKVEIKNPVKTVPRTETEDPPIVDEKDWNRKIFDSLQELIQIQKDTYALFKKIDERTQLVKKND